MNRRMLLTVGMILHLAGLPLSAQDRQAATLLSPVPIQESSDLPPPMEAEAPKPEKANDPGMGGFGGPGGNGPGYSITWYPSRKINGSNQDLSLVRQNLLLGYPIWTNGTDRLIWNANIRNSSYFTDQVLPDTGRPFPNQLWSISTGLMYLMQFENDVQVGLSGNFGSASDKPFASFDELFFNFLGFVRFPAYREGDSWMLSLFYSPVGNLNFPIPGVAYVWNASEQLRINIGLPFSLSWRPTEDWNISINYLPLTNINARVTYRIFEPLFIFAGYEFLNEAYFLADRFERRDRFMVFEQRLIGGLRYDLPRVGSFELNAGYAFDREFGEGRNQGDGLRDRVEVAPGAFLGATYRLRF